MTFELDKYNASQLLTRLTTDEKCIKIKISYSPLNTQQIRNLDLEAV